MLLDPRNGVDWDLPPFSGAARAYVIASIPRSGSTLLANGLWDTHLVGAPKEYLNPMQVRDWEARLGPDWATRTRHALLRGPAVGLAGRGPWTRGRLEAYLERVRARRTDPSGWFGLKLHHHHLAAWFLERAWDIDDVIGVDRWIAITREDHVAQAVSWARALQTGAWASWQRPWRAPVYDARLIRSRLEAIAVAERGWGAFFSAWGIEPLRITYEELVADREATLRKALRFLDVEPPATLPLASSARQADAITAEWIARFREESG